MQTSCNTGLSRSGQDKAVTILLYHDCWSAACEQICYNSLQVCYDLRVLTRVYNKSYLRHKLLTFLVLAFHLLNIPPKVFLIPQQHVP